MKEPLFPMALALAGKFSKPTALQKLTLLVVIALLGFTTRGWTEGGTVVAWGDNRYGQINVPAGLSNVVAIAAGEWHNLALRDDGTLIGWGVNNAGQRDIPPDVTNVIAVATGGYHNLAIKADGTVRAWGQNEFGQCAVPAGLRNVVAVSGGWSHSLALKADGTVVAWGRNHEGQATVPSNLNNVVAISAAEYHNMALKSDGTIVAWGWNGYGQTTIPSSLSNNVVAVCATGLHSLALKNDGTVVAWGYNAWGQTDVPAGLSGVVAIRGGGEHSLALKSDGTVVGWGSNSAWASNDPNCAVVGHPCSRETSGQIDIPSGLSNVRAIAGGNFHSIALKIGGGTPTQTVRFTLTKNISPAGTGSINVSPASGTGKYDSNTVVTLTAVPAANKIFTGWSGAASGTNNPIQITMNGNKTVTATFASAFSQTATLSANVSPIAAGVVNATPYDPSNEYATGTHVTLTAQPYGTNVFAAWYGGASGISNQIDVVMNTDKTVTALFNNPGKFVFQHTDRRLAVWFLQNTQRLTSVLLNNGLPAGPNWQLAGTGDVDNNGSKDLLFRGSNGKLAIWLMNQNHKAASVLWNNGKVVPAAWRLAGSDDFNSDGKADLLWHNTQTRVLNVWLMDGTTNTSNVKLTNLTGPGWRVAATAKFDTNNSPDIVFQAPDGRIAIWLMNGYDRASSVLVRSGRTAGTGFVAVGATDIDQDGNTDIVFQRADGVLKVWLMAGATFNREVTLPTKVGGGWKLRAVK